MTHTKTLKENQNLKDLKYYSNVKQGIVRSSNF